MQEQQHTPFIPLGVDGGHSEEGLTGSKRYSALPSELERVQIKALRVLRLHYPVKKQTENMEREETRKRGMQMLVSPFPRCS